MWYSTRYTKEHEWIRMDGQEGTVGISKHAADALGDVVYVDLPDAGSKFGRGDTFGAVESVKAASDLYMPAGGELLSVNDALADSPCAVNEQPEGDGWMLKVRLDDANE